MLEDYSCNEEILQKAWNGIKNSRVCIVGIGAVGSWIAANLVQSGVENLVLIDNDVVDISNLHRQWGYVTEDVGKRKTICLSKRLRDMNESVKIHLKKLILVKWILLLIALINQQWIKQLFG